MSYLHDLKLYEIEKTYQENLFHIITSLNEINDNFDSQKIESFISEIESVILYNSDDAIMYKFSFFSLIIICGSFDDFKTIFPCFIKSQVFIDNDGSSLLHLLCYRKSIGDFLKYMNLIKDSNYEININQRDRFGRSALFYCCKSYDFFKYLIYNFNNADLQMIDCENTVIGQYLVKSNCDPWIVTIFTNYYPDLLLQEAVKYNCTFIIEVILDKVSHGDLDKTIINDAYILMYIYNLNTINCEKWYKQLFYNQPIKNYFIWIDNHLIQTFGIYSPQRSTFIVNCARYNYYNNNLCPDFFKRFIEFIFDINSMVCDSVVDYIYKYFNIYFPSFQNKVFFTSYILDNYEKALFYRKLYLVDQWLFMCYKSEGKDPILFTFISKAINLRDYAGNYLIHIACQSGIREKIELYLSAGSDPNSLNEFLDSPLHIIASYLYTQENYNLLKQFGSNEYLLNRQLLSPKNIVDMRLKISDSANIFNEWPQLP